MQDTKKIFIGVDFAKEKFHVALIKASRVVELDACVYNQLKSSPEDYKQLHSWVKEMADGYDPTWLFCGEHTRDYSSGLCDFLYGKSLDMWLENAKASGKVVFVRKTHDTWSAKNITYQSITLKTTN